MVVGAADRRVRLSPAACRGGGGNTVSALNGTGCGERGLASAALPATSGVLAVSGPTTQPQSREAQKPRDLGLSCC